MALPHTANGAAHGIVAYSDSETLSQALRSGLEPLNGAATVRPLSSLRDLAKPDNRSHIRVLVVDLRGGISEPELSTLRDWMNDARIVGLGDVATLEHYRSLRRAGCDEYFTLDEELPSAVRYIAEQDEPGDVRHVAVHGIKSGIGTSLITAALAQHLSARQAVDVVDLNWTHPSVNYWLGEDRTGELHRLAGLGERIDAKMTHQLALSLSDTVRYFGGYDVMNNHAFDEADAAKLFKVFEASHSCTLWRTDAGNPQISARALQHADVTVLVTDRSLSSLRAVNDMTALYQQQRRRVITAINDPYAESDMKVAKFRALLQADAVIVLPRVRHLKTRLLDGIVPGSRRSGLHRAIARLARELDPQYDAVRRWPWQ